MISRIPLVSMLCAVLCGAFGQIATSAADGGDTSGLQTRVFRVDLEVFLANVRKQVGLPATASDPEAANSVQKMFSAAGVDLRAPKSLALDGLGLLFVRATKEDLDAVDKLVTQLNDASATGILTNHNYGTEIEALQQRTGVEQLGEPEVVSTFGRGVQKMRTDYVFQQTQYTFAESKTASVNLETRVFRIDTNILADWRKIIEQARTNLNNSKTMPGLVELFSSGVVWSPPKTIKLNETNGELLVCATASELTQIAGTIGVLSPPRIYIKARFIEAPEDGVETILKAGTVVDSGEKNTVEIITSVKMEPLIGQLASRTNILFIGGRTGMVQFLNGRVGMICHNGQLGEFVISFVGFTNSTYVPPPDLDKTNDYPYLERWINTQHYDMIPTLLDDGATIQMQVTNTACPETAYLNTAYSSFLVIPMGQADVRIRDGETLVLASPNMAAGETNRVVAFFTPTIFTPTELDNVDRAIGVSNKDAPQIHIKARFVKMAEADAGAILTAGIAVDTKETNTVEIMTDAKATPLLRKLESRGGITTLGELQIVTLNGRQGQLRSGNLNVDLTPILLEDGHAIHLQPTVSAPETLTARANVWDNQTLILASNNPGADNTRLLVFITVTVVDPAGNRVYSDENHSRFNPPTEIPRQDIQIPTPSP